MRDAAVVARRETPRRRDERHDGDASSAPHLPTHGLGPVLTVWASWLVLMCGVNLATPLYAVYRERFGFSNLVLTSIFAVYALVLVPSLMLFGQVSDRLGRRVVITAGLCVSAVGLVLFVVATGTAWLYGARVAEGLAVGMIGGAATAALVELDPDQDARRAAMFAGLAQAVGSAGGPLVAGALAQWAPAPRQLCFLVVLGLTFVATGFVLRIPETAAKTRGRWHVTRPSVPRQIRGRFARVSVTAAVSWAAAALYLSVVPSYAGSLLHTHDLALLAAIAALALVASSVAQVASRRGLSARSGQTAGLALLAAGLLALVLASPFSSLGLLLAGSLLAGAGHGLAFLGAQDELNRLAPPAHRGEVTAAFITCIYLAVAGAVLAVGLLGLRLSLDVSVGGVAAVLGAVALAAACWQRLARR